MRSPDLPSLAAGGAIIVVGVVLLLDERGTLALDFGGIAPVFSAAVGAILVALGASRRA